MGMSYQLQSSMLLREADHEGKWQRKEARGRTCESYLHQPLDDGADCSASHTSGKNFCRKPGCVVTPAKKKRDAVAQEVACVREDGQVVSAVPLPKEQHCDTMAKHARARDTLAVVAVARHSKEALGECDCRICKSYRPPVTPRS